MRVRELHHALAEVGLDDFHAEVFQVGVELDLLAGHRLDLGHDHAARGQSAARGRIDRCAGAELADDLARFGRVFGQVHHAADRGESFCELIEQLGQAVEVGLAAALQVRAALLEIEILEGLVAAAPQAGHGLDERLLEAGVVEGAPYAAREVTSSFRHASWKLL